MISAGGQVTAATRDLKVEHCQMFASVVLNRNNNKNNNAIIIILAFAWEKLGSWVHQQVFFFFLRLLKI